VAQTFMGVDPVTHPIPVRPAVHYTMGGIASNRTTLSDVQSSRIFLKMDTQGYDLEVFSGATGALDRVLGLQSELSVRPLYEGMPHYIQSLETYQSAGFDLYNLSVVNRIETGGLLELNCFMRRSGA
jgi:hypothetical protein